MATLVEVGGADVGAVAITEYRAAFAAELGGRLGGGTTVDFELRVAGGEAPFIKLALEGGRSSANGESALVTLQRHVSESGLESAWVA